ncbi:hypothetical protein [Sphingomonas sp. Leaf10]|uniref:hypothetical protein n=1 Tax=Sphingomonas sp. Leaf10 TaxID=1735676 RepID=UPI0006F2EB0E|nr:hypothetical protein [Sphingomonas sp. Leaf10]KQM37972.1 hypothetical protein ASE59_11785 [Sphingomonas sp. Leaf10]
MNAFTAITPALCEAADDRIERAAADLIARYRRGLAVAIKHGADQCVREEARRCLAKVEAHAKRIEQRQMFAADTALVWLGRNMAGPRIEAAIAAGERRRAARPLTDRTTEE